MSNIYIRKRVSHGTDQPTWVKTHGRSIVVSIPVLNQFNEELICSNLIMK